MRMKMLKEKISPPTEGLVDATALLRAVWKKESRPSLRWLRDQQGKTIPMQKIGHRVWFDIDEVRDAMKKGTI